MEDDLGYFGGRYVPGCATFRNAVNSGGIPANRPAEGCVSEPFEMIAARDAADEVELIAETEPVVGQKCVGALRSDGEEKFVVFAAGYGGFEIDGSGMHSVSTSAPTPDWCRICRRSEAMPSEMSIMACTSGRSPSQMLGDLRGGVAVDLCQRGVVPSGQDIAQSGARLSQRTADAIKSPGRASLRRLIWLSAIRPMAVTLTTSPESEAVVSPPTRPTSYWAERSR